VKVSGVLAWHPEVAMTAEEIDEFLSGRWVARLATIGRDGYPYVSPFWYYWDGECICFALTRNRRALGRARCSASAFSFSDWLLRELGGEWVS
jgi:nitroimidazol reductase NimA-like FMN-containing flavoprotein (pyridoxamine 5'-phosphate oxidase superfamily)